MIACCNKNITTGAPSVRCPYARIRMTELTTLTSSYPTYRIPMAAYTFLPYLAS